MKGQPYYLYLLYAFLKNLEEYTCIRYLHYLYDRMLCHSISSGLEICSNGKPILFRGGDTHY